jgi:predicted ATPase
LFSLTRANAADVAAICWRLAGLALALALAAAKTKFLDPATLLSRLGARPAQEAAHDAGDAGLELRAARRTERGLLGRLSAFVGGFPLSAAEAVGAAGDVDAEAVIDHLGTLVEQSLVTVDPEGGEERTRYGMLEPRQAVRAGEAG